MKRGYFGPLALGALWFGAAVSLAEIATGGLVAGAGLFRGTAASLAGHAVGALLFAGAGWISWTSGKKAIAACDDAFGPGGPVLFGVLNFVQLVGWTAVMVAVGARSLQAAVPAGETAWKLILGAAVFAWAVAGPDALGKANAAAGAALGVLCVALSAVAFGALASGTRAPVAPDPLSFGAAFELSVVMPLSWLPLVGDYVAGAPKGKPAVLASAAAYGAGSAWMFAIGMAAALAFGSTDPVAVFAGSRAAAASFAAAAAAAIVLLSTLTTAFLDARSAGVSLHAALPRVDERLGAAIAAAAGLGLALASPAEKFESFLLLVGGVFAPLYAVLFADRLLPPQRGEPAFRRGAAFACWAAGVVAYRALGSASTPIGVSLPVMALTGGLYSLIVLGGKR